MPNVPPDWDAYLRLQQQLDRKSIIDQSTWGLEAGLNLALRGLSAEDDLDRAIRSACRRERHRARLRLVYLEKAEPVSSPVSVDALDARRSLGRLRLKVGAKNFQLICRVAEGHDYRSLSAALGDTPGALRARVFRLRRDLADSECSRPLPLSKAS
jgi:hypothetical protein